MPVIRLSVNSSRIKINRRRLRRAAEEILDGLGYIEAELSIVIVDDEEMARLNMLYRQVNKTTDVLSFPMLEGEVGNVLPELLGDVVISAPTAQLMSMQQERPLSMVLDFLLVHGILHLVGYDHERSGGDAHRMEEKSLELMKELGHSDKF